MKYKIGEGLTPLLREDPRPAVDVQCVNNKIVVEVKSNDRKIRVYR